jgi:hypothetical protein
MSTASGLTGAYRDRLASGGAVVSDRGWRANRIVSDCNRLLAALMRGRGGLQGILYLALGQGEAGWDGRSVAAPAGASTLAREWLRRPVAPGDIRFIDALGDPVEAPTDRPEIALTFNGADLIESGYISLREFGLFGGDATDAVACEVEVDGG